MPKIFIVYYSDYGEAMYDALTLKLLEYGNSVFRLNIHSNYVDNTKWCGHSQVIDRQMINEIISFKPDIVLNFNNCLPINLYNRLVDNSVICVLDADPPSIYIWNKEYAIKFRNKIKFLGFQSSSKAMYEKAIKNTISDEQYLFFPPATAVKNENKLKEFNISFIGSNLWQIYPPTDKYFYSKKGVELAHQFKNNYYYDFLDAHKKFNCNYNQFFNARVFYVGQDRLFALKLLSDLGLEIFGRRGWDRIAFYDLNLAKCFNNKTVSSLSDNQSIYNSSKISVNISHPLASTSFSWRVMDIMASDSCLLMERKKDWFDLFSKYLSKKTIDSIIYSDFYDMRKKAIKLLHDDNLRERCVAELNNAIEKNGRWEHRFRLLGNFLNVNFFESNGEKSTYIYYKSKLEDITHKEKRSLKSKFRLKNRVKIIIYCIVLASTQIPFLGRIFNKFSKNKDIVSKIERSL